MTNNKQVLSLLGLAKRAGQVKSGEETVLKEIQTGRARFVLLAADASAATQKKFTDKCHSYGITLNRQFSRNQLSAAVGQKRTIFCIDQQGFARKFEELTQMK